MWAPLALLTVIVEGWVLLVAASGLGWPLTPIVGITLLVAVPAALVLFWLVVGGAVFAIDSGRPNRRAYMDRQRMAVLVLIARPESRGWQIRNHVTATKGGHGARLRAHLVPQAQAIAGPAQVKIYGKPQNATVMAIYVKQLTPFGFRVVGKFIQWP